MSPVAISSPVTPTPWQQKLHCLNLHGSHPWLLNPREDTFLGASVPSSAKGVITDQRRWLVSAITSEMSSQLTQNPPPPPQDPGVLGVKKEGGRCKSSTYSYLLVLVPAVLCSGRFAFPSPTLTPAQKSGSGQKFFPFGLTAKGFQNPKVNLKHSYCFKSTSPES